MGRAAVPPHGPNDVAPYQLLVVDQRHGLVSGPGKPFLAELAGGCEQFVRPLDHAWEALKAQCRASGTAPTSAKLY